MAGALRARATEADPLADERLEAADVFARRYDLRGKLRAVWPRQADMRRSLVRFFNQDLADLLLAGPWPRHCGRFIARAEEALPWPTRLRLSGCRSELPKLQAYLRQIPAARTAPTVTGPAWQDMSHAGVS